MTDAQERAAETRRALIVRADGRVNLARAVLSAHCEGLGASETAVRVARSRQTVWRIRCWLGLDRDGRLDSRRALDALTR